MKGLAHVGLLFVEHSMPDIADVAWSEHDERNSEAVPNGWPTGAFPAYTDLVGQMMMGATKRFWNKINPIYQTIGTGDNYVVQTEIGIDQINLYEILCIRIDRSNTTSTPTLQFGATNARTIVKAGPSGYIPLVAGDMFAGNSHTFWYNGAFYILVDPAIIVGGTVQPYSPNLTTWAAITRATGFDTWVATPSSDNLRAMVPDESGTGALLFQNGALGTPISGVATNLTGLPLTTGVTGTLPIGNGGTGQITAGAAFDALAPTTTRGDIVFRNATTNARLAASTAGYHLQTNGAGADPTWAGFLQAGTSAVTRTWQDKARERISVEDFGAVGDGVTNDTIAIQAAETYRASVGGVLRFGNGKSYVMGAVTINRANGGGWVGQNSQILALANNTVLITASGAVYWNSSREFFLDGLKFNGNSKTGVTVFTETDCYLTTIRNCEMVAVGYCVNFIRGNGITISNIYQFDKGTWKFSPPNDTDRVFTVNISNVLHQSAGSASFEQDRWFEFYRCISVCMTNVQSASLDGVADAIHATGACEGIFLSNSIIGWPKNGLYSAIGVDGVYPAYIYFSNVGMDQAQVTSYDISGFAHRFVNCNATFGDVRSNTGYGFAIRANAYDIDLMGIRVSHMYNTGLLVEAGAQVKATSLELTTNHVSTVGYDLDLGASTTANVVIYGKNNIGTINATGQTIKDNRTTVPIFPGPGTFASAVYQLYTDAVLGGVIVGKTGSSSDLYLSTTGGGELLSNPTGTATLRIGSVSGIIVGSAPTGGDKGAGTINAAAGLYVQGVLVASSTGFVGTSVPTGGVGYATGAGGTVTQATSKSTGVTLNKATGQITMNAAALAAGTIVSFVLTNSAVAATDVLVLNHISGGTVGAYTLNAQCAAGSATINIRNNTGGSLSDAIVIQFALIKGVNA
jgi:hypothetical protein